MFERVRSNIVKSGEVGRLVSGDFTGAMVWANLLEENPQTGERLDYREVAGQLEAIRTEFENENQTVHIIGFAKIVGDISDGATSVVWFFLIALGITAVLLYLYSRSVWLTVLPLTCSMVAVIWQMGTLSLLGYSLDPMNILTPFLIFAIGVSHGVQKISAWTVEKEFGGRTPDDWAKSGVHSVEEIPRRSPMHGSRETIKKLLAPGVIALVSDTIGFLTILFINIRIIQELAITASIGVAVIILTNLLLLPVLLSWVHLRNPHTYRERLLRKAHAKSGLWDFLASFTEPSRAAVAIAVAAVLFGAGFWKAQDMKIGDSEAGVPELRPESRYNRDAVLISEKFALGVDVLTIVAETVPDACTENYNVMEAMDRFAWNLANVEGVQKVITLPIVAKVVNSGWNEGNINWRILPRDNYLLRQALSNIETDTGLLNRDCSAMPIMVFTTDHRAETIVRIVNRVKELREELNIGEVAFDMEHQVLAEMVDGDQRRHRGGRKTDAGARVRIDHHPLPGDLPDRARHPVHRVAAGLQPAGYPSQRGIHAARGVLPHVAADRPGRDIHRIYAGCGRRHLDFLGAPVPGRHGYPPVVHLPGEHGRRDRHSARAGPLADDAPPRYADRSSARGRLSLCRAAV
jgi:predicted RND superfamily exporter protein